MCMPHCLTGCTHGVYHVRRSNLKLPVSGGARQGAAPARTAGGGAPAACAPALRTHTRSRVLCLARSCLSGAHGLVQQAWLRHFYVISLCVSCGRCSTSAGTQFAAFRCHARASSQNPPSHDAVSACRALRVRSRDRTRERGRVRWSRVVSHAAGGFKVWGHGRAHEPARTRTWRSK